MKAIQFAVLVLVSMAMVAGAEDVLSVRVPDAASTVALLGFAASALALLRRKV